MASGDPEDEPPVEDVEVDDGGGEALDIVGVAMGLGLMAAIGLVFGGVTVGVLWRMYPPVRGGTLPMACVAGGSVLLAILGWLFVGRRLGRRPADWFVVGYGGVWILLTLLAGSGAVVEFLRAHAAQSLGLPSG